MNKARSFKESAMEKKPSSSALYDEIRQRLEDLVDTFVARGVRQEGVFEIIVREVGTLRKSAKHDPDPADDETVKEFIDDPANDWPGAENN